MRLLEDRPRRVVSDLPSRAGRRADHRFRGAPRRRHRPDGGRHRGGHGLMPGGVLAVATTPAIDRISLARGGIVEGIVRAAEALETPGGKAVHAAMVARALGAPTHLVAPTGGRRGELLRALLAEEGIESTLVPVDAETRATHTLVDADLGDLVEVHDPQAALQLEECDALVTASEKRGFASVAVIAGGLPPGAPPDLHARLVA